MVTAQRIAAESSHASNSTGTSLRVRPLTLLMGFSVVYFLDVCLRASGKYLWFDEIYTVIQARLSLHDLSGALKAGFDFNPPLIYLITGGTNSLFGHGLIATRLPEIVGFWIFSVCLFRFVSKRAGLLAGFSAMVLPMFTGAFYYSYDARPPGIVLGFCGLALLAWQMSLQVRRQDGWLIAFSFALFAAFMTHCYAITLAAPFGVAELVKMGHKRRLEYRRWAALLSPVLMAGIAYIPLLKAYRATSAGTVWLGFSPVELTQIGSFYGFLLTPCILILLLVVTLVVIKQTNGTGSSRVMAEDAREIIHSELAIAAGFLLLPVFGLLLALKLHSPFYDRYFLAALVGVCIFVGFGVGLGKPANWAPVVLAGALALGLLSDISSVLWKRVHGKAESIVEPSSGFSENSSLQGPLENYQMLVSAAKKGERVIVMWPMDFLYLVHYAPELRSQLYYVQWDDQDVFYRILERVHQYAPYRYHTVTSGDFYSSRSDFMFFGVASDPGQIHVVADDAILKSLQFSNGHFLADVKLKPPKT